MARKTYEVKGMMEWHPVFTVGRTRIQVPFTGGHLGEGSVTAATFETSDSAVQTVIERSDAFRSGRIRLRHTAGMKHHAAGNSPDMPDRKVSGLIEMEFDSIGMASDFLQYDKGVPVERLMDEASCRAEARRLGFVIRIPSSDGPEGRSA